MDLNPSSSSTYRAQTVRVGALMPMQITRMAEMYLAHYEGSCAEKFQEDLKNKDYAVLVFYGAELVGFTTVKVYETLWAQRTIRVIFSGDTLVLPEHWGQMALSQAWIALLARLKRQNPLQDFYWLLIVKGHRTFRYLDVFSHDFYPHWSPHSTANTHLKPLADHLAFQMFGPQYNADTGVVAFEPSQGHLKSFLAEIPENAGLQPSTIFFLERNPGYIRGHELVCLCELSLENMKPLTARIFRKALQTHED